jgi:hypothetical protein
MSCSAKARGLRILPAGGETKRGWHWHHALAGNFVAATGELLPDRCSCPYCPAKKLVARA